MIVVMAAHATREEVQDVEERIRGWGYGVHPIYGQERTVIGAVGVPEADKAGYMEQLESLACVERVIAILRPYKFVSRDYHPEGTVIRVRGVEIGGPAIQVMAGPCTVETEEQLMASARVAGLSLKRPRTADVTVRLPGFLTPRIDMHRCSASMTTNTPAGFSTSMSASATWVCRRPGLRSITSSTEYCARVISAPPTMALKC